MSRDKTVPVFIAVCAFFVLNRLLVPLMKLPRHVPEVLGLGYYVVLVIISLVLGYLLYGERLQNWHKRPDCPSKDKWLSLLITVVLSWGWASCCSGCWRSCRRTSGAGICRASSTTASPASACSPVGA